MDVSREPPYRHVWWGRGALACLLTMNPSRVITGPFFLKRWALFLLQSFCFLARTSTDVGLVPNHRCIFTCCTYTSCANIVYRYSDVYNRVYTPIAKSLQQVSTRTLHCTSSPVDVQILPLQKRTLNPASAIIRCFSLKLVIENCVLRDLPIQNDGLWWFSIYALAAKSPYFSHGRLPAGSVPHLQFGQLLGQFLETWDGHVSESSKFGGSWDPYPHGISAK